MYDYLIVGAGIYGSVFARKMKDAGKRCLVIERRNHIGGNIYSSKIEGIEVHQYGPHIFHTDSDKVWEFINEFAEFNHFIYSPIANYNDELYNLPFNMNTFTKIWDDVKTPKQAQRRIRSQVAESGIDEPSNLEEQAISLVGIDIYEKLIKGYTEKQWGRPCKELPAFIIKRLPVRLSFDNNYFNHPHQGIPKNGYTKLVSRLLEGTEVKLGVDYLKDRNELNKTAKRVIFTGPIDEYYGYCYGGLQYRSLYFETEVIDVPNYQGVAGMNYTDLNHPYTRIIEHKHFMFGEGNPDKTVITREYPANWKHGDEPYYPINDDANQRLYEKYRSLSERDQNIKFGGRLGLYKYMDMDQAILKALEDAENELLEVR